MNVTKAIIIADPWIGLILDGSKTWEMRSRNASFRGWIGLIRKGTGAVWGVARLADVGSPLLPEEMIAHQDKHRIPAELIRNGEIAKWNRPWILTDVNRLSDPVPYRHEGGVTWVQLDPDVSAAIARQIDLPKSAQEPQAASEKTTTRTLPPKPERDRLAASASPLGSAGRSRLLGQVELTAANIKNNHIYLRSFFHKFPPDAVGGSNSAGRAARDVLVEWGDRNAIETDLDGEKKFFRARSWTRQFFEDARAEPGDRVIVLELEPYRYRVELQKRHGKAN